MEKIDAEKFRRFEESVEHWQVRKAFLEANFHRLPLDRKLLYFYHKKRGLRATESASLK